MHTAAQCSLPAAAAAAVGAGTQLVTADTEMLGKDEQGTLGRGVGALVVGVAPPADHSCRGGVLADAAGSGQEPGPGCESGGVEGQAAVVQTGRPLQGTMAGPHHEDTAAGAGAGAISLSAPLTSHGNMSRSQAGGVHMKDAFAVMSALGAPGRCRCMRCVGPVAEGGGSAAGNLCSSAAASGGRLGVVGVDGVGTHVPGAAAAAAAAGVVVVSGQVADGLEGGVLSGDLWLGLGCGEDGGEGGDRVLQVSSSARAGSRRLGGAQRRRWQLQQQQQESQQ